MASSRLRRGREPEPIKLDKVGGFTVLERFSKRFGPGDIDGAGATNLLGRPALEKAEVLVRETAQNSWDARDRDIGEVDFQMRLRRASSRVLAMLRDWVLPKAPPADSLKLGEVLTGADHEPLWLLEISDRGTRGLAGPLRNDVVPDKDGRTDFADFVLTLGAPRDTALGGGTYGFGKTISYTATRTSTVVIWTRCMGENGQLEHRLIASAMGAHYSEEGIKYTGRHWWGQPTEDDRIEPVVGEEARLLGEQLFARGFESDECGTSLLLIAPEFGEVSTEELNEDSEEFTPTRTAEEYAATLSAAALKHLWPKLVPDAGRDKMSIRIFCEDDEIGPAAVAEDPVLKHFANSLQAVRSLQAGEEPQQLVEKWQIEDGRGRGKLLGHLAVTPYLETPEVQARLRHLFPAATGGHHLCLMRHQAELVVKYQSLKPYSEPGWGWAAVFKPVEGFDDAFADAEPPSHDDWLIDSVRNPRHKSPVRISLNKTKKTLDDWAAPSVAQTRAATTEGRSAAALAAALGSLMGDIAGTGPEVTAGPTSRSTKRGPRQPRPTIASYDVGPHEDFGYSRWVLEVELQSDRPVRIVSDPVVRTAGRPERDDSACKVEGWESPIGTFIESDGIDASPGRIHRLHLRVLDDLAIDPGLKVEA
ncbi:hypothetical protein ACPCG0_03715 [Propionibacteriaceae bacterium Y1923]